MACMHISINMQWKKTIYDEFSHLFWNFYDYFVKINASIKFHE